MRILLAAAFVILPVQSIDVVDHARRALETYLEKYEGQLNAIVADEDFVQESPPLTTTSLRPAQSRRLKSEVAFLRLPGNREWMGYRRVISVDGKPVADTSDTLAKLLGITNDDQLAMARLLVMRSAEHNLGLPRTVNMPNLPLELLHPGYRSRFDVVLDGRDTVKGRAAVKLLFTERAAPSIVAFGDRRDLLSRIRAWVDLQDGTLYRADVRFESGVKMPGKPSVSVRFERNAALGIYVPADMREEFFMDARVLGTGRALYSNFRRFQTTARIVPQ